MIDWQATGIYIAYPTTDVLKLTYPGHRTYVNDKHTKVGMAKRSFRARAAEYKEIFQGEIEFIPIAVVRRLHLSGVEAQVLAALNRHYKTVGYTSEWFDTNDRPAVVALVASVATHHPEMTMDIEHFNSLRPNEALKKYSGISPGPGMPVGTASHTLNLLSALTTKGFSDAAFWRLHHFRLRDVRETIGSHRSYCQKVAQNTDRFAQGSENILVQRRLAWVLAKYEKSGRSAGDESYFCELADAAFQGLPPGSKK